MAPGGAGAELLGLYVHVPFCEAKCSYCHFAIDPRRPDDHRQERYVRAVLAEIAAAEPGRADTLYFGGGTPSLLAASRLGRVVEQARRRFVLPDDAEVTVEANPRDLDEDGYRALRGVGASRFASGHALLVPDRVGLAPIGISGFTGPRRPSPARPCCGGRPVTPLRPPPPSPGPA